MSRCPLPSASWSLSPLLSRPNKRIVQPGRESQTKPLLPRFLSRAKTNRSRPHVSDDNPFSESQFRTMKYRPGSPDRFGCIQDSRAFRQSFFQWYNQEHRHSGVGLLTPAAVHYGRAENLLRQRQDVLNVAYQRHPERFVRNAHKPPAVPSEVWINRPVSTALFPLFRYRRYQELGD